VVRCQQRTNYPERKRSPRKAQERWLETHDSGVDECGERERALRIAFASLKHSVQKVDDHW